MPQADDVVATPQPVSNASASTPPGSVVFHIEAILEDVFDGLCNASEVAIDFKSHQASHERLAHQSTTSTSRICFPGKNQQEAKKFARVLLILQLSHDALVSGTILTKRHIFYQHQDLFEKQRVVDELVDDLALTLSVSRNDLNIVAAAKGIVSGPLLATLIDGTRLDASIGDQGSTIPEARSVLRMGLGNVSWVLVVEKEAVFRSLSSSQFWRTSIMGPGLLVTAKGYPDMVTLSFLRLIQQTQPSLPILILVDFDPDGLNIFHCYRYGDIKTHFTSTITLQSQWIGIKSSQILELGTIPPVMSSLLDESGQDSQSSTSTTLTRASLSSTACRVPYAQLSQRDRKLATSTLKKLFVTSTNDSEALLMRRELQVMLMMGVKTEIQSLDNAGSISAWLDHHLAASLSQ